MSKTPEGIVLTKCITLLKKLEIMGWVRHFERMNVGLSINMAGYFQRQGKAGTSDLIVFISCDDICHTLFLEVKSETGIQSLVQKEFENKWMGLSNVTYALIRDHKEIKLLVENIRRKSTTYGKLEEFELPMELI